MAKSIASARIIPSVDIVAGQLDKHIRANWLCAKTARVINARRTSGNTPRATNTNEAQDIKLIQRII